MLGVPGLHDTVKAPPSVARSRRFRWRGMSGGILLGAGALIALFSVPRVSEGSWPDVAYRVAGWAAFIAGAALRFWATLYIGGRKQAAVVSEGPYSICRNPLYVGSLLLALAAGLFLESLVFAAALLAVSLIYMLATVPAEEEYLHRALGGEYDRYRQRVPAYWPSFRLFHTPSRIDVNVHTLRLECARASRWIWLPLVADAVNHLRTRPSWPHLFTLP